MKQETSPAGLPRRSDATRTSLDPAQIANAFQDNLNYLLRRFPAIASRNDNHLALAYTVRDRLLHRWIKSAQTYMDRSLAIISSTSASRARCGRRCSRSA